MRKQALSNLTTVIIIVVGVYIVIRALTLIGGV